ncbi:MAG: 2TM domain-containing protein [Chitinophagaceae bacterium]|nr:2TM domain-containing protein [Chitinophagaceae bacterium]
MKQKLIPSAKQKSTFMLHVVIFILGNAAMWGYWWFGQGANHQHVYPWASWVSAAWGLSLIAHWAALYTNYEDAGNAAYENQAS